jgi:hypothetical protein
MKQTSVLVQNNNADRIPSPLASPGVRKKARNKAIMLMKDGEVKKF